MDRLVAQVLDSRLVDASVARVLASDELWLVVDEVAQSPAVTEAITQQSAGFADQVAGEVGERSRERTPGSSASRAGCCAARRAGRRRAVGPIAWPRSRGAPAHAAAAARACGRLA